MRKFENIKKLAKDMNFQTVFQNFQDYSYSKKNYEFENVNRSNQILKFCNKK